MTLGNSVVLSQKVIGARECIGVPMQKPRDRTGLNCALVENGGVRNNMAMQKILT